MLYVLAVFTGSLVSASVCEQAQKIIAGTEDLEVEVAYFDTESSFGASKPDVNVQNRTVEVKQYETPGEVWCKMKTQNFIQSQLQIVIPNEEGSCKDVNRWVFQSLNITSMSYQYLFDPDRSYTTGSGWLSSHVDETVVEDDIYIQSPNLVTASWVPFKLGGVFYCKIWYPNSFSLSSE